MAAALVAVAATFAPGWARAETGAPLPQGYTSDIAAQQPAPAPAVPVQPVSDDDDDVDPADEYADNDPSALTDFREPLAPYGVWVTDATYGTVWVPNPDVVGADFAPYQTAGQWAMTDDDEWMWQSDYDWGYIPFHYGRWVWINARGWSWIPGRTYSPAWVSWRVGDGGYIGWAPMPPSWYWDNGIATNLWVTPYAAYCFCPTSYVFYHHVHNYVVRDPGTVRSVAASTRAYKPAHPTIKGGGGSPGGHAGAHHFRVASPSVSEAGISAQAAAKAHASADMRSRAFATRSSTAAVHRAVASGHGFQAGSFPINSLPSRSGVNSGPLNRDVRSPMIRSPRDAAPNSFASDRSAPNFNARPAPVDRSAPNFNARPAPSPRPSFSPPSSGFSASPPSSGFRSPSSGFSASRPAPSFSAPSRPSFSAPSRPSFSAPSRPSSSFSGGSRSFSVPSHSSSPSFRAPSVSHSSGGGFHVSGGGHRR